MRILVHGGTKDAVRIRFGDWPNFQPEWLNDPSAISLGLPSFGLIFPDGRPVLLYREWVNPERRGGIHFTVLIDPEDDLLWEKAGWNAAGLLHCIFGGPRPRRDAFLAAESLTPEYVRSIFDKILNENELSQFQPTIAQGDKNLASLWRALLVGSLRSPSLTHANLNALALNSRPLMQDVACWTAEINPFARGARGWLIGGTVFQANGLGAGLLLDDGPFGQKADASAAIQAGRVAIEALDAMYKLPEHREGVQRFIESPPWPSKPVLEFITEAVDVGLVLVGNEDTFRSLLETREKPSPKKLEAAYANAVEKTDQRIPIGPFQTKVLLQYRHDLKYLLRPQDAENLDRKMLCEQLDDEDVPPNVPRNLDLPPDLSLELCERRVQNCKDRYGATERCLSFLSGVSAAHLKSKLWDFYSNRAFHEGNARLGENPEINRSIELRALERLRGGPRNNEWLAEALKLLSGDRVTKELDQLGFGVQEPIDDLISITHAREHPEAVNWLKELAETPLRYKLKIETKLAILDVTDSQSWRDLRVLRDALRGACAPGLLEGVRTQNRNAEYLEMLEWAVQRGQLTATQPQFVFIARILGFWPAHADSLRDLAQLNWLFQPYYKALLEACAPPPALPASPKSVPSVSDGTASGKPSAAQRQFLPEAPAGNPLDEISELARRIDTFPRRFIDSDRKLLENINLCGNDQDYDTLFDLLWIVLKPPAEKQRKHEEFCPGIKRPLNWRLIAFGGSLMAFWGIAAALRTRWKLSTIWMDQAWQTSSDSMNILSVALLVIALGMIFAGVRRVRYCLLIDKERCRRAQVAIELLLQSDNRTLQLRDDLWKMQRLVGKVLKGNSRYHRALALFLAAEAENSPHLPKDPKQRKKLRAELIQFLVKEQLIRKESWFL